MTPRGTWCVLVLALISSGCGERRSGGGIVGRRDVGPIVVQDAGVVTQSDGGAPVVDSGMVGVDLGVSDSGGGGGEDSGEPIAPIDVSIRALQDETNSAHPVQDTRVRLSGVVVTAVQSMGTAAGSFWVQDIVSGPYSGILIFVPPEKVGVYTVVPGEVLALNGVYKEYFDVSEVVLDVIETQMPGEEPAPLEMSPAEIATGGALSEAFEGVLVRVSNVTVLNDNPDAPMDFGEFTVTGGLRIDDQLYRLTPRPAIDTTLSFVIGVHHHAFANYKLLPRTAADIGPLP